MYSSSDSQNSKQQTSITSPRTLCLEQAVLRTTSAPESLRQCLRLAGGWEEHRGTTKGRWLVGFYQNTWESFFLANEESTQSTRLNPCTSNSACHPDCPLGCNMLPTTGSKQPNPENASIRHGHGQRTNLPGTSSSLQAGGNCCCI